MKALARSLVVVLVALIAVPALVVTTAVTSAVQLLATTALIMGGTQHPLSPTGDTDAFVNNYFGQALDHYIVPGNDPDEPVATYAVIYPAEFAPFLGVADAGADVGDALGELVALGESVYLLGVVPEPPPGWKLDAFRPLAQMVRDAPIDVADGPEIVELTTQA